MSRAIIYEAPRAGPGPGRDRRHQHLRPQLRRALRGQRPRARRPDREDQHRPAQVDARDAAAARVRARLRPGRARQPSRPAAASAAPDRAARQRAVRADLLGRGARRGRAPDAARPRHLRPRRHPRLLAHRQPVDAPRPRASRQRLLHMFGGCTELWSNISAEAEIFAVRMTYGAKAEYKSGGPRAHRLRQLAADRDVGLEPGRRHVRHRHAAVPQAAPRSTACGSSASIRGVTRSSHELADEHVFIRPSTDAAALIAMAYVIASEGLHDQAYLDRYVLGFDEAHLPPGAPAGASYRSYLHRATPTACARRRSGPRRSPACRPTRSGGWPSSSPPASRRRCSAATRRGARSTASSSTAPPTRSPR